MKTCTVCGEQKPLDEFVVNRKAKDGLATRCRPCHRKVTKASAEGTLIPSTRYDVVWPRECPRCKIMKDEEDYPLDPKRKSGRHSYCKPCKAGLMRERTVKRKESGALARDNLRAMARRVGLDADYIIEYDKCIKSQCEICGGPPTGNHGRLAIDHNHNTHEFRGLLCGNCNTALGFFKDSPQILSKALAYLTERGHYGSQHY